MRPSARTNWPTSFSRSQAMNLGPRNIRSIAALIAADQDAGHGSPRPPRDDPLERHRARALQQHDVAGPQVRAEAVRGLVGIGEAHAGRAVARALGVPARPLADGDDQIDPEPGRLRPRPRGGTPPHPARAPSCPRARPRGARAARRGRPGPPASRSGWRCSSPRSARRRRAADAPGRASPRGPPRRGSPRPERGRAPRQQARAAAALRSCHPFLKLRSRSRSGTSPKRMTLTSGSRAARKGSMSGSSSGTTATPPGRRPWRTSALAEATASTVPSSSRCTGARAVTQRDVGRRERRELRDLPEPPHPHLDHRDLGVVLQASSDSGTPISVFSCPGCPAPDPRGAEHGHDRVLGGRLAGRAGDRDHARAQPLERQAAGRLQHGQRVLGHDRPAARCPGCRPRSTARPAR